MEDDGRGGGVGSASFSGRFMSSIFPILGRCIFTTAKTPVCSTTDWKDYLK